MGLTSTNSSQTPKIKIKKEFDPKDAPKGLARLVSSDEYKNLSDDKKKEVRGKTYDKYLVPYYKMRGVQGPSKEEFINNKYAPMKDVNEHTFGVAAASLSKGGLKTVGDLVDLHERLFSKLIPNAKETYEAGREALGKLKQRDVDYLTDNYEDTFKNHMVTGVSNLVGQEGIKLPVYTGIGKGLSLGEGLLKGIPIVEELAQSASPTARFAYHTMKTAVDGYLSTLVTGGSKEESEAAGEWGAIGYGAGKTVSTMFKKSGIPKATGMAYKIFLSKVLGAGGTKVVAQSMHAAASPVGEATVKEGYQATKLTEQLTKANAEFLNAEAKAKGHNSYWMSPQVVKRDILNKWADHVKDAVGLSVANNPKIVHAHVASQLDKAVAANPVLGKNLTAFEKISGVPASQLISDKVVDDAKRKAPGALKKMQAELNKSVLKSFSGLGPGAASINEAGLWKKISKTLKSDFKLQGHTNQVMFAYANRDSLPKKYLPVVRQHMKDLFGGNEKRWAAPEKRFNQHLDKLMATGHVAPDDMRGVFRSTKLVGKQTIWQKILHEEYEENMGW